MGALEESRNLGEGPCSEMGAEGDFSRIAVEADGNCYLGELMEV